jgi:hypothetical protein
VLSSAAMTFGVDDLGILIDPMDTTLNPTGRTKVAQPSFARAMRQAIKSGFGETAAFGYADNKEGSLNVKSALNDEYDGLWLGDEALFGTPEEAYGTLASTMNAVAEDSNVLANLLQPHFGIASNGKNASLQIKSGAQNSGLGAWALTNTLMTTHDYFHNSADFGSESLYRSDLFRGVSNSALIGGVTSAIETDASLSSMRVAR